MNFLRKTLLTNNLNTVDSDVELEDLESGGRAANSPFQQPPISTTINSSSVTIKHPLDLLRVPSESSALSITHSQALLPSQSAPSPFSFHGLPQPPTPWPNLSQAGPSLDTGTSSFQSSAQTAPQTAISTTTFQASRKRAHQIEEHNNRVRIIELGPTVESTRVSMVSKTFDLLLINYISK